MLPSGHKLINPGNRSLFPESPKSTEISQIATDSIQTNSKDYVTTRYSMVSAGEQLLSLGAFENLFGILLSVTAWMSKT